MKTKKMIRYIMYVIIIFMLISTLTAKKTYAKGELLEIKPANVLINAKDTSTLKLNYTVEELRQIKIAKKEAEELERQKEEERRREEEEKRIVFDGLTMRELTDKLNRTLHSTIAGKGEIFAKLSDELGLDPYLAVAIVMHESGCKWECSGLLKTCNNVGGMKGAGGCGGGAYAYFPTLDEGIRAYMYNLYKNYASYGLTTPEAMGPKYAASETWAVNVRRYMNEIRAN
ncbi:MAG: glucosaminidase domain-containing protein [Bacilli bacterium]|nr:glucosaminidase domain-containing protein [Bacilli bacterium]